MARKSIYLINPAPDYPSYSSSDVFYEITGRRVASFLSLAAPVVAAMIPQDFEVTLCEENDTPIDFDAPVDFVGITGLVSVSPVLWFGASSMTAFSLIKVQNADRRTATLSSIVPFHQPDIFKLKSNSLPFLNLLLLSLPIQTTGRSRSSPLGRCELDHLAHRRRDDYR